MVPHTSQLENLTFLSNTLGIFVKSDQVPEQHLTDMMDYPSNLGASRDTGSIPGLERSPRGGNGNPRQYSCQENPMDRVHGVAKSRTRLNNQA